MSRCLADFEDEDDDDDDDDAAAVCGDAAIADDDEDDEEDDEDTDAASAAAKSAKVGITNLRFLVPAAPSPLAGGGNATGIIAGDSEREDTAGDTLPDDAALDTIGDPQTILLSARVAAFCALHDDAGIDASN